MGPIVAGIITAIVVGAAYGVLIAAIAPAPYRPVLLRAALYALPLQPLAFFALRLPLDTAMVGAFGQGAARNVIALLYAPLTEEPMKWAVLMLPFARKYLTPVTAVPMALAIGLGFALGEIGFLAFQISKISAYAALPFTQFFAFGLERFLVALLHGGFIVFLAVRMALGRSIWPGLVASLALHFLVNLPIGLVALAPPGLDRAMTTALLQLWTLGFTFALGLAVARIHVRLAREGALPRSP